MTEKAPNSIRGKKYVQKSDAASYEKGLDLCIVIHRLLESSFLRRWLTNMYLYFFMCSCLNLLQNFLVSFQLPWYKLDRKWNDVPIRLVREMTEKAPNSIRGKKYVQKSDAASYEKGLDLCIVIHRLLESSFLRRWLTNMYLYFFMCSCLNLLQNFLVSFQLLCLSRSRIYLSF